MKQSDCMQVRREFENLTQMYERTEDLVDHTFEQLDADKERETDEEEIQELTRGVKLTFEQMDDWISRLRTDLGLEDSYFLDTTNSARNGISIADEGSYGIDIDGDHPLNPGQQVYSQLVTGLQQLEMEINQLVSSVETFADCYMPENEQFSEYVETLRTVGDNISCYSRCEQENLLDIARNWETR